MRLALLAAFLSLPAFSQEVTITYDQATPTIEKTLAKVYPKDMHGYFVQACNWTTLPAQFNPEWMLAKASGILQVQHPAVVLLAASDTRSGSKKAIVYRGLLVAGAVYSGFAAGGLIDVPILSKYAVGGIPILAPFVKNGASNATKVDKPADWVEYDGEQHTMLDPGDCVAGAIAAAAGGPKNFSVTVQLKAPVTVTDSKPTSPSVPLPAFPLTDGNITLAPVVWSGVTHPQTSDEDDKEARLSRMLGASN